MSRSITLKDNKNYVLEIDGNDTVTLIVDSAECNIEYAANNADANVLVYIKNEKDTVLNESGSIVNSKLCIKYIELANHCFKQNTNIDVCDNSILEIRTIYLGINDKKVDFDLVNKGVDTEVNIRNNVVCLDKAKVVLNVIGTIVKGAKRAKCHQKNHCLTVDSPEKAVVLPVLKIDENDVEASHSLSSGTIDEEVMFYMNSRGLSKKEALNLMVLSYLMPNEEEFNVFENGKELYELSLGRVKEVCSM